MPKEWILNQTTMRFQLNRPKHVGHVAEEIRKCMPKSRDEWQNFYYGNVRSEQQLEDLGRRLYVKVTEVCAAEIASITEDDCIGYIKELVIDRTYDGYESEVQTIYGQLQNLLGVEIQAAPDEWDRLYNVDFFIKVGDRYIGLQVCPAGYAYITQIVNELEIAKRTHMKFTQKFGGAVFYVLSVTQDKRKIIQNQDVIENIRNEIERLRRTG